mmetsp:Transcript_34622/g.99767  ORF Transcript_34622/g.99767 Transcript_34622/m.99767 type:complete len:235 (+) Transcript_34622:790-1494(+)
MTRPLVPLGVACIKRFGSLSSLPQRHSSPIAPSPLLPSSSDKPIWHKRLDIRRLKVAASSFPTVVFTACSSVLLRSSASMSVCRGSKATTSHRKSLHAEPRSTAMATSSPLTMWPRSGLATQWTARLSRRKSATGASSPSKRIAHHVGSSTSSSSPSDPRHGASAASSWDAPTTSINLKPSARRLSGLHGTPQPEGPPESRPRKANRSMSSKSTVARKFLCALCVGEAVAKSTL